MAMKAPNEIELMKQIADRLEEWLKPEPDESILTHYRYTCQYGDYWLSLCFDALKDFDFVLRYTQDHKRGLSETLEKDLVKLEQYAQEARKQRKLRNKHVRVNLQAANETRLDEHSAMMAMEHQVTKLARTLRHLAKMFEEGCEARESAGTEQNSLAGYMSVTQLAEHFQVDNNDALRKRLERFRRKHFLDDDVFIESDDVGKHKPRFFYNVKMVASIVQPPREQKRPSNVPPEKTS